MVTILEGTVTSGLGKGAVFMSIDYYKKQVKEKLGFEPYPGTLNIKIDKQQTTLLNNTNPIRINAFKKDNKSFGGASCYKAKINDIQGFIIIPDMTEHEEDMVEFIAPINIKEELKINDGDKVKIELK
jgi:riboflavin kinase